MRVFPNDFLWGAATSAHQVEGYNIHSDWWAWESAGRVLERSAAACDHYNRFREDFDLAKQLHHNAHRFSIEWSRLEPEPGRWDEQAMAHYKAVVSALRTRGLEPVVTLFHFTSPQWFSAQGGWTQPHAMRHFRQYVERVVEAIGGSVRYWVTFNEPMIYVFQGYLAGEWPPGKQSWRSTWHILERLVHAHTMAYRIIHHYLDRRGTHPVVGIAKHMLTFTPCNPHSFRDRISAYVRRTFFNYVVMNAFNRGHVAAWLSPHAWIAPRRRTLDFIGLNYYTRDFVLWKGWTWGKLFGEICSLTHHHDVAERNSLNWEIYPEGIYRCLAQLARYHLPILITENGICTDDDTQRERFIRDHLNQVARAMDAGITVIGYLYWSLLDNFEWNEGFTPRFGLVEVDYATQARHIRPSAKVFAEICRTGRLIDEY